MNPLRIFAFAALILLAGCSHPVPKVTVDALDTSLSITPRAEHAAENAILDQISRMGRGDRLILIPITGDAQNDTGGRILRLVASTERQAYDNDLRQFQMNAKKQYAAWVASLDPNQMRTDILGTLEVAGQEFAALPKDSDRRLIVLSDFLEDDSSYRFVQAPQLANAARARAFAAALRTERGFALPGVPVCLGRLESSDFAPLSTLRKEAVQAFWVEYLDRGANRLCSVSTGPACSPATPGVTPSRVIRPSSRRVRKGGSRDRNQITFRVGRPRGSGCTHFNHCSLVLRHGACG